MQNFAGSSRGPKPMILRPRIMDSYTGRTIQRAGPIQPDSRGVMPLMVPPQPFGQPPARPVMQSVGGQMGGAVTAPSSGGGDPWGKGRRHQPVPYLAKGGPAKKGKPYVVGEKGPELFVPDQDGQVVAHSKLKKAMKQNRKKKPNPFYP